jgi:hypothetical protein
MMGRFLAIMGIAVVLAACGDKPQTAGGIKQDAAPYAGTGKPYVDRGWKEGDKVSWEQHLKARTQAGQNDYSKAN